MIEYRSLIEPIYLYICVCLDDSIYADVWIWGGKRNQASDDNANAIFRYNFKVLWGIYFLTKVHV